MLRLMRQQGGDEPEAIPAGLTLQTIRDDVGPGLVLDRDQLEQAMRGEESGYDHLDVRREYDKPLLRPDRRVLAVSHMILTWRETREHAATIERGVLFTLEDGLIVEQRVFPNPGEARTASTADLPPAS
jgi:hypothetical protein